MTNAPQDDAALRTEVEHAIRFAYSSELETDIKKAVERIMQLIRNHTTAQVAAAEVRGRIDELEHVNNENTTWLRYPEQYRKIGRSESLEVWERIDELSKEMMMADYVLYKATDAYDYYVDIATGKKITVDHVDGSTGYWDDKQQVWIMTKSEHKDADGEA